jgi:sporulation protein YlmC with PRC-barrel domain
MRRNANIKTMVAVSALLLTVPALAEEPVQPGAGAQPAPSATAPTTTPSTAPAPEAAPSPTSPPVTSEPMNNTTTEPAMKVAPSATDTSPGAAKPMDQMGAEPNAAPPAPDAPKQAAIDAPAAVVITDLTVSKDGKKMVAPLGAPVDQIAEMDVYDAKGKKIGEVDSVLEDKNGEAKAIAVGHGGFLGFGEKHVVLTLDQVKLKDGTLVTEISEDQLAEQPAWTKKK